MNTTTPQSLPNHVFGTTNPSVTSDHLYQLKHHLDYQGDEPELQLFQYLIEGNGNIPFTEEKIEVIQERWRWQCLPIIFQNKRKPFFR